MAHGKKGFTFLSVWGGVVAETGQAPIPPSILMLWKVLNSMSLCQGDGYLSITAPSVIRTRGTCRVTDILHVKFLKRNGTSWCLAHYVCKTKEKANYSFGGKWGIQPYNNPLKWITHHNTKEAYRKLHNQFIKCRIESLTWHRVKISIDIFLHSKLSKILCLHAGSNLPILTEAE